MISVQTLLLRISRLNKYAFTLQLFSVHNDPFILHDVNNENKKLISLDETLQQKTLLFMFQLNIKKYFKSNV